MGVDDEDGTRQALHLADAAEGRGELGELLGQLGGLLLGEALELTGLLAGLELLHEPDPLLDRDEVGEHAAQPALVDVGHARPGSLLGDRRPDEQDGLAPGDRLADEVEGGLQPLGGLGKVDDVDPVALREDERAHLGIPAASLVAEVDSGFEQLPHRDGRHGAGPPVRLLPPRASSPGTVRVAAFADVPAGTVPVGTVRVCAPSPGDDGRSGVADAPRRAGV